MHPECAALAAVLASPYWAERAVPTLDKQHKVFYQHILTELGLDDERTSRTLSMRHFGPLADDIHDQAKWGRPFKYDRSSFRNFLIKAYGEEGFPRPADMRAELAKTLSLIAARLGTSWTPPDAPGAGQPAPA